MAATDEVISSSRPRRKDAERNRRTMLIRSSGCPVKFVIWFRAYRLAYAKGKKLKSIAKCLVKAGRFIR